MKYIIYKMYFLNGVHFGKSSLDSSLCAFCADTLFSALCQEAVKVGDGVLEELLKYVNTGGLCISDAFPFCENEYFLPKPFTYIDHGDDEGDSSAKKVFKKMKYIPFNHFEDYLSGTFSTDDAHGLDNFGFTYMKTSAYVRNDENTMPYRVGVYYYNDGNGIYFVAGIGSDEIERLLDDLMDGVSKAGIGGKRSSGLGRFDFYKEKLPESIEKRINNEYKRYMTLSISLPVSEELGDSLKGADYSVIKRSGFVSSDKYSDEMLRKKDLYVLSAGSCFDGKFTGAVYDVSNTGKHPVYRYAVPMFMGVDI